MEVYSSPLSFGIGRKKFTLNLNNFRNTYYRILNSNKIKYKSFIADQILSNSNVMSRCIMMYKVFKDDRRRFDIGNICSIHQKFFEDAFVELGRMGDDRGYNIPMCFYSYGGVDTDNPRVEILVIELKDDWKKQVRKIINQEFKLIESMKDPSVTKEKKVRMTSESKTKPSRRSRS